MPNWCSNTVRVGASPDTLKELLDAKLSFETLMPRPAEVEDWYEWNVNHWGTKWDCDHFNVKEQGRKGFIAGFNTAWSPPLAFFRNLCEKKKDLWVKCDWNEESGYAGVFVMHWDEEKGEVNVKSLDWDDWCMEEWDDRMR